MINIHNAISKSATNFWAHYQLTCSCERVLFEFEKKNARNERAKEENCDKLSIGIISWIWCLAFTCFLNCVTNRPVYVYPFFSDSDEFIILPKVIKWAKWKIIKFLTICKKQIWNTLKFVGDLGLQKMYTFWITLYVDSQ